MAKSVFISSTLPKEAVGLIPRDFTLDYNNSEVPLPKAELVSRLKGKDGLICHIISTIDEEVLASAPTLKVVANVAVGYNNIDVAAARRRGDDDVVVADRDVRRLRVDAPHGNDRRLRVDAPHGDGAPRRGGRPLRPLRAVDGLEVGPPLGRR